MKDNDHFHPVIFITLSVIIILVIILFVRTEPVKAAAGMPLSSVVKEVFPEGYHEECYSYNNINELKLVEGRFDLDCVYDVLSNYCHKEYCEELESYKSPCFNRCMRLIGNNNFMVGRSKIVEYSNPPMEVVASLINNCSSKDEMKIITKQVCNKYILVRNEGGN